MYNYEMFFGIYSCKIQMKKGMYCIGVSCLFGRKVGKQLYRRYMYIFEILIFIYKYLDL